jgi:uncharacterized protein
MKIIIQRLVSVFALVVLLTSTSAFALDLGQAKAQGLVGETTSGYLAIVVSNPEAEGVVNNINAQRRAQYQSIADNNGTSLSAVEALAGQTAIERTSAGHFINTGGGWETK